MQIEVVVSIGLMFERTREIFQQKGTTLMDQLGFYRQVLLGF